jgi:alkylation response protein AidB-like acyl-CoA dehydrogenase
LLNGTKIFITNGPIADVCTVLAKTDKGPTAFVVDTTTPGFVVGRELDKLGCRSSPTAEIHLQDCRVPASSILSVEGEALWRVAFECFDWERTVMLAGIVGGMRATIDQTIRYAKERQQFGKPIAHFQVIAHKIAEMEINYQVCRNAVYKAAWLKQEGRPHQLEASVAKALLGSCRWRTRWRPSRSTAATGTCATSRSSGPCATPSWPASAAARPRSRR